jgi:hypothetical protein
MTDEEHTEHTERALLQRRIKNQRRVLRRLERDKIFYRTRMLLLEVEVKKAQTVWMRHAAEIAASHWFGSRIAKAIRGWA